jgi:hypothetical protein
MTTRKAVPRPSRKWDRGHYLRHFHPAAPEEKTRDFSQEFKVQFLQILNGESVEFVCLVAVNEVVNQRYHNAASDDIA